ncbi:hypothetical protein GCM10028819_04410 [Spirosoma humi]
MTTAKLLGAKRPQFSNAHPKYKTVIFVPGCFLHSHESCLYFIVPKTRTDWWHEKINGNKRWEAGNESKLISTINEIQ